MAHVYPHGRVMPPPVLPVPATASPAAGVKRLHGHPMPPATADAIADVPNPVPTAIKAKANTRSKRMRFMGLLLLEIMIESDD